MPDIDQQIRARLDARASDPGFMRHREAADALRAVLDKHYDGGRWGCRYCSGDGDSGHHPYPCDTVRTIARELGITEEANHA